MIEHLEIGSHNLAYQWINNESYNPAKPVIVFLHEGLGCMQMWKDFPVRLCSMTGCRGLMYDRYGYGESARIEQPRENDFLYHEAAVILPELLAKLNITEPAYFFGHSDGGTISLIYAALHPSKAAAIVAEASHIFIEPVTLRGIKQAINAYKNDCLKEKLEKYHGDKTDSMFYSWANVWTSEETAGWSIELILPEITSPVLAIQGEDDNYGTQLQTEIISTTINGPGKVLHIPECGHIPHHEKRDIVLDNTAGFFQSQFALV
ncbi:MAG: alpha/beta fold hydrolase [Bacteroidales bacterium]